MFYLHLIHYNAFFCAQLFNSILALLIVKRAGKLFGAYRHVMLFFTLCSMWFSGVQIVTQPVMYMKGSMLVMFIDHDSYPLWFGDFIICLHCSSYVFLISVFAAQFLYRYCALCEYLTILDLIKMSGFRLQILKFFPGYRIFLIFLPCFILFVIWFQVTKWGTFASPEKRVYLGDDLKLYFNIDQDTIPLLALYYWKIAPDGEKIWIYKDLAMLGICVLILASISSIILFSALKIYFHMRNASANLSQKTQELNRQLFIMLTVQTIIPLLLMYTPMGLALGLPIFNLSLGKFVNIASASIAIYPMIEPLVAMYCISDFRKTIKGIFLCQFSLKISTIHPTNS